MTRFENKNPRDNNKQLGIRQELSRQIDRFTKKLTFGEKFDKQSGEIKKKRLISQEGRENIKEEIKTINNLIEEASRVGTQSDSELWGKGVDPNKFREAKRKVS